MCALKTEYCVEIRVPKENGRHKFGSGYTLGPNWVLTAHHVLFGEEVDVAQSFKITWRDTWRIETGDEKEGGKELLVSRDDIVWYHEEYDIALIRFEPSYRNVPGAWWELAQKEFTQKEIEWQIFKAGGFLSNLHDEAKKQRRVTPQGSLGACSEGDKTIALDGSSVKLDDNEDWAGFSGSPVFVKGKLVAVVRTLKTGESSLDASFISAALDSEGEGEGQPALRDVPGFLVPPKTYPYWKKYRKIIQTILERKNLFVSLKESFREKVSQDDQWDTDNVKEFAEALYQADQRKVVQCLNAVFADLLEASGEEDIRFLAELSKIWLIFVAAGDHAISGVSSFKESEEGKPLEVKTMGPPQVDVEVQAANSEVRKPEFYLKGKRICSPFDLTPKHDTGIDKYECLAAVDTVANTRLKTVPGSDALFVEDVKQEVRRLVLQDESIMSVADLPDDSEDQRRFLAGQLESENIKGNHYIRLSCEDSSEKHSALSKLHSWCPGLLLFEVSKAKYLHDRAMNLTDLARIILGAEKLLSEKNTTRSS